MIQVCRVHEVGSVNGELVVGIELGFERILRPSGVGFARFEDEHSVVCGRTVEVAEYILHWRRCVWIHVRREDDVPVVFVGQEMQL